VVIDVWMQHPTLRFLSHDMFASLRRWTGAEIPDEEPGIGVTVGAMDAVGVDFGLLSAWSAPRQQPLISNDEVAEWIGTHPDRLSGLACVDLDKPMEAVRELRRCVEALGFKGLRVIPWLWEAPPTDRRYYPLYAACVELGVPFFTQVGHTGPLRASETGRPIPYIDQVALDFPELVIVGGHIGYPLDRGDGRRLPQARERPHRHLGVCTAPLPTRARRAHALEERAPQGPFRH
jgi:predicted TIM-barrel fold metal-dependent hydrolase